MADAMLYVVGLGPGDARYLTAQAQTALQAADVLCGYTVYIADSKVKLMICRKRISKSSSNAKG